MGLFRLFLALLVVVSHTQHYFDYFNIDIGLIAVSVFFFISGYLMPLTFEANYKFQDFNMRIKNYTINRFLKIYPIYWISLMIFLVHLFLKNESEVSFQLKQVNITAYMQNILLLGLNQTKLWGQYLRFNNPAWSLDVELQYYILVPFIMLAWKFQRKLCIGGLMILSFISSYLLMFPSKIIDIDRSILAWAIVFFCGFFYNRSIKIQMIFHKLSTTVFTFLCFILIAILVREPIRTVSIIVGLIIIACHLLVLQKERHFGRLDYKLGELSYPVYIFHIFVVGFNYKCVAKYLSIIHLPISQFLFLVIANIVLTVLVSYFILTLITNPIEKIRNRFRENSNGKLLKL